MKKNTSIVLGIIGVICLCVIVLLPLSVPFIPFVQAVYDDGGTCTYRALAYKVVKWNKIIIVENENGELFDYTYNETSVFWFPDSQKDIDELWELEMERRGKADTVLEGDLAA